MLDEQDIKEVDSRIQALETTIKDLREQHQQEIEQLREYYENMIALIPGHVYWMDRNHTYLGCNDLQAKNLNLSHRSEIAGKTNQDFVPTEQGKKLDEVNEMVMATGNEHVLEEYAEMSNYAGFYLTRKVAIKNRANEIVGLMGVSFDITERKRAEELTKEKVKLEEQKKSAEAYAERMRLLATSMAEELKIPYISIKYLSERLNHYFKSSLAHPPEAEVMAKISTSIHKESAIALHMMEMLIINLHYQFEDIDVTEFNVYSMLNVIKEALKRYPLFETYQSGSIYLQVHSEDDFEFFGDSLLVMHVFFHLLKNALHFIRIEKKGMITIKFSSDEHYNKVHFRDTARGMSEEVRVKLFQDYFSTKQVGTGIGLPFCKLVMESMNGSISCEAEQGKYAEFILQFPKVIKESNQI